MSTQVEAIYRAESRRVLATLIRLLGDFDRAEEAMQDAFRAAVERWPEAGVPDNPAAWLITAGRHKAIDRVRKQARLELGDVDEHAAPALDPMELDERHLADDQLRLVFTCCHPALPPDAQVALTLREVCGLTTEEIASAFLTPVATLYQRIVRAKAKIRDDRIPYRVPEPAELGERLEPRSGSGSTRCCGSSTWSSTRATRRRAAPRWSAPTSPARRSASGACSSSSCPSRRCSACSR
jgi:RNA polymerase sigma-70 factor, ECF subfamily